MITLSGSDTDHEIPATKSGGVERRNKIRSESPMKKREIADDVLSPRHMDELIQHRTSII
jgi:hypothetical protein